MENLLYILSVCSSTNSFLAECLNSSLDLIFLALEIVEVLG